MFISSVLSKMTRLLRTHSLLSRNTHFDMKCFGSCITLPIISRIITLNIKANIINLLSYIYANIIIIGLCFIKYNLRCRSETCYTLIHDTESPLTLHIKKRSISKSFVKRTRTPYINGGILDTHALPFMLIILIQCNTTIATVNVLDADPSWGEGDDRLIVNSGYLHERSDIPTFDYHENKIISKNCVGPTRINHIGGSTTFDCSKPLSIILFGPIEVIHLGVSTFLIGNTPCKDAEEIEHRFLMDCRNPTDIRLIALVTGVIVLNVLITAVLRYLWMTRITTIKGYKILMKTSEFFSYTLRVEKVKISERVTYVNQPRPLVTIDNSNVKELKYNKKSFLLAFFLLIHPTLQMKMEVGENGQTISFNGTTVLMNTGEKYEVEGEVFVIPPLIFHSVVTPIYKTAETTERMVKEWYCKDSQCDEYGKCSGFGQYGRLMSETMGNRTSELGDKGFVTRYCSWGSTGCFAKDGCWRWAVTSFLQSMSLHTVHEIGSVKINSRLSILKSQHCEVKVNAIPELPRLDSYSVIESPKNEFFLCPFPTNKYTPTRAKLGDIQIFKEGKIMIAPDRMICTSQRIHGPSCSGGSIIMKSILEKCQKMPGELNNFNIDMSVSGLQLTHKGLEPVELRCPKAFSVRRNVTSCGLVKWKLWRLENSAQEARLSAITTAGLQSHSIMVPGPCGIGNVFVKCGGVRTAITVSWLSKCINDPTISEHEYFTEEEIDVFKQLTIEGSPEEYKDQFNGMAVKRFFSNIVGVGLSGYGTIALIIVIYLLIRK